MRRLAVVLPVLLVALLSFCAVSLTSSAASGAPSSATLATADTGASARVVLTNDKTKKPLAGVTVSMTDSAGKVVGSAVSDATGVATIPLPDLGVYTFTADKSTLPSGVKLSGALKKKAQINIMTTVTVNFDFNTKTVKDTPFAEQVVDATVSGLEYGLIIALAALGLSLIFGTTGLTNFAHGEMITFGAIVTYGFNSGLGLPVVVAGLLAVACGGLFGWSQDRLLWRPLRRRGTGLIAMMIVSIGFGLFLRNLYQYVFGPDTQTYTQYASQQPHHLGPIDYVGRDVAIFAISIITILVVTTAMARTRLGKAMRAVSDNPALSASSGMRVDGVISSVWILGAALSALSGVLLGLFSQVNFLMGYKLLLMVFAATTLGGLGTIWGAIIGSLIIGLITEVGPQFGVPSSIKDVGALLVLVVILLLRPQGILGRAERIG